MIKIKPAQPSLANTQGNIVFIEHHIEAMNLCLSSLWARFVLVVLLLWSRPLVGHITTGILWTPGVVTQGMLLTPTHHLWCTHSWRPAVARMSYLKHPWQGFHQLLTNQTIAVLHHYNCRCPLNILPQKRSGHLPCPFSFSKTSTLYLWLKRVWCLALCFLDRNDLLGSKKSVMGDGL